LADKRSDKRATKIEQLLNHPLHAALWATKFSDITGNETRELESGPPVVRTKFSQMWHDWFRKRIAENMPYDQIAHGVLCATSRETRSPEGWIEHVRGVDEALERGLESDYAKRETLDLYWRRKAPVPIEQWGERTAAAFLGIRLECAQCHKHPFDRWSQADYRAYANIFAQVAVGKSPDAGKLIDAEKRARRAKQPNQNKSPIALRDIPVREVYLLPVPEKPFTHPDTGAGLMPKALGGPVLAFRKGKDLREDFFQWLRSPENPFFARSFVNRIWGHYLGSGLVNPVDDFSLANPPSNDKLLDALAKDFVAHGYDIRHIERVVLNSRTYQLSAKPNETNKHDKVNYARRFIRPIPAEAVVDVLNGALGTTENFGPLIRPGSKAIEVGASELKNPDLDYVFRLFGRPLRSSACDCERAMEPALPQRLFLMTDATLMAKFNHPKGRLRVLLDCKTSDDDTLTELFLATLSRYPTERERKAFASHLQTVPNRRDAFTDTLWALINTREFILNR
jgi:hypothetical protein